MRGLRGMRQQRERIDQRLARRGGAVELLRVPAALFGIAASARGALYDRGLLPSVKLEAPVISVGNLSAGGTGKTPMVAWLARELARRERRVGILSRGYGARAGERSDEAELLGELLGDVPHVQDADRVRGAHELLSRGVDVVVLDDGFQHRRLARELDLVLVDALRPWGLPRASADVAPVAALLPRGLLRERPNALARAHAVVLTRVDRVGTAELVELRGRIESFAPGVGLALAVHAPLRLRAIDGATRALAELDGRTVDLASGIGNPEAFEESVRALGARIGEHRQFPDHHAFAAGDLDGLARGERWLVVTAKDLVKLRHFPDLGARPLFALDVELALVEGLGLLEALLDSLPLSRAERERAAVHAGAHG